MTVAPEKLKDILCSKRESKRKVTLTGEDFVFGNSILLRSH